MPVLVSVERYTETLLRYENSSFAEYTAVERNTTSTLRFTNCEYVHQLQSERDTAGEAYSFAGAAPFAPAKLCAHCAVIF